MKKHPDVKTYLAVFAALAVLTVVTVAVSYLHLPITAAVFVALAIATFKAALVATFFMHLKGERALIYGLLAVTLVFMGFLFILPISDMAAISDKLVHAEGPASAAAGHVP